MQLHSPLVASYERNWWPVNYNSDVETPFNFHIIANRTLKRHFLEFFFIGETCSHNLLSFESLIVTAFCGPALYADGPWWCSPRIQSERRLTALRLQSRGHTKPTQPRCGGEPAPRLWLAKRAHMVKLKLGVLCQARLEHHLLWMLYAHGFISRSARTLWFFL